jgi:hypothetical protein
MAILKALMSIIIMVLCLMTNMDFLYMERFTMMAKTEANIIHILTQLYTPAIIDKQLNNQIAKLIVIIATLKSFIRLNFLLELIKWKMNASNPNSPSLSYIRFIVFLFISFMLIQLFSISDI